MAEPAQLIASNLAALPHPDGAPRVLAGFGTALLPDPLREQVTQAATEIGEAIVYLLESNGWRLLAPGEQIQPDAPTGPPEVAHLHCRECDARLMSLNLTTPERIVTDARALITGIARLSPDCPHDAV